MSVGREDVEAAGLEGDRPFRAGTARAAWSYPGFRRVYAGFVASNIGSWMQMVVLGQYGYFLTQDPAFVARLIFAQLIPLLLLSLVGGSLADKFDRRKILVIMSLWQAAFALLLALIARDPHPSSAALLATIFAIGLAQAAVGPTFSSVLPSLVEPRDLDGAVSLISVNMNLSRVIGAIVGPFVFSIWGVSWVFAFNALTYIFIIVGVWTVRPPRPQPKPGDPTGLRRVLEGFAVARRDPVVGRVLTTMATFSFFCLIFITQMPTIAAQNLGIEEKSAAYGWLYGTFGFGALIGAVSVGSFLAGRPLGMIARVGLAGFAVWLAIFALLRSIVLAYPVGFLLGYFYFLIITSLLTAMQQRLNNNNRSRVMALWIMAFGGVVPIGNLIAGEIIRVTSLTIVLLFGVVVAVGLFFYASIDRQIRNATNATS